MKYKLEELKKIDKIAVYLDNEEEWKKFKEHFNVTDTYYGPYYYSNQKDYSCSSSKDNIGAYKDMNYTTLEFSDILFPENIVENFQIY